MRQACALLLGALLTACAASPRAPASAPTSAPSNATVDEAGLEAAVLTAQERVLETLAATDPRFAARVGGAKEARLHAAAVKALAAGDADAAIEDGALDFFSFTARGRSLLEAEEVVARLAPPAARDARLEHELLVRLVAGEHARLEEDKALPRSASTLVRGVVETWGAPESRPAAEERDARVARRLDEIRASLNEGHLSRARLAELDDALDPLERIATPDLYGKTVRALSALRLSLDDSQAPAQEDDGSAERLRAGLRAHLGVGGDPSALRTRLATAEKALRERTLTFTSHASTGQRAVVESWTLRAAHCAPAVPEGRLRSLAAPPERATICGALQATRDAPGDVALAALHDDIVVALWALALHEDHATPSHAAESARLLLGAQPDREAHLVRQAAAHPVEVIAAGLAASALAEGAADLATRWLAFGDAPIDLAMGALAPTP